MYLEGAARQAHAHAVRSAPLTRVRHGGVTRQAQVADHVAVVVHPRTSCKSLRWGWERSLRFATFAPLCVAAAAAVRAGTAV